MRQSDPAPVAPALDVRGQRAVVDDRVAPCAEAAGVEQRGAVDQDHATRRCGHLRSLMVGQRERVQQLEEIHECRHQPAGGHTTPERFRAQRYQRATFVGLALQRRDDARREPDVGIQQQHPWRGDVFEALLQRPQFAGPANRRRRAGDDGEVRQAAGARDGRGVVTRLVVDHDHRCVGRGEGKRAQGFADPPRFVAGGDQHREIQARLQWCRIGLQTFAAKPRTPRCEQYADPASQGEGGGDQQDHARCPMRAVSAGYRRSERSGCCCAGGAGSAPACRTGSADRWRKAP